MALDQKNLSYIDVVRFPCGKKMFIDSINFEDFIQRNKETIK